MDLSERFEVRRSRDDAVELLCCDDALLELMTSPDGKSATEIVEREGDRRTTRTRYSALGREGVATFHFTFLMDGNLRFEKRCDGKVWRKLEGHVEVEEIDDSNCEVEIRLSGRTKALVPELAIKAPLKEQMRNMAAAIRDRLATEPRG